MTEWARRPKEATPSAMQRRLRDERGRTWVGTVVSGTLRGGEEHAEVVFVCEDQPSELKLVGRLDSPPEEAAEEFGAMSDEEVQGVFRRARAA